MMAALRYVYQKGVELGIEFTLTPLYLKKYAKCTVE
jgi:hypothetical protein